MYALAKTMTRIALPVAIAVGVFAWISATHWSLAEDPYSARGAAVDVAPRGGGTGPYASKSRRLRQGTKLDKVRGQFRLAGDRIAFYPDDLDTTELTVLENLALERLAVMVVEDRNRNWVVSGTVTEYQGKNYLLVSRAVMASASSPRRTTER